MSFPYRRVHLVGVGGIGMSALAETLVAAGVQVSGCDREESERTRRLREKGVTVFIGHNPAHLQRIEALIVTSAISKGNMELRSAKEQRIPVLHRSEGLALLMEGKRSIAISGTHGKSTVTALVGHLLAYAGKDPTVLVGAEVMDFGGNCRIGRGYHIVVEADESDGSFLNLTPDAIALTNIELDHPDHYPNEESLLTTFADFVHRVSHPDGGFIFNADCPKTRRLIPKIQKDLRKLRIMGFGFCPEADFMGHRLHRLPEGLWAMEVFWSGERLGEIRWRLPGEHNALNVLAAIALCLGWVGIPFEICSEALATFQGVKRRFEVKGVINGVTLIDDYAHHPTEVRTLLRAARQAFPDARLWVIFQPHRYTRTRHFWKDFGSAFKEADGVWVTEIFAAWEEPIPGVSGELVAEAIQKTFPQKPVRFVPEKLSVVGEVAKKVRRGDVVLIVGAGDIYRIIPELEEALRERLHR